MFLLMFHHLQFLKLFSTQTSQQKVITKVKNNRIRWGFIVFREDRQLPSSVISR